MRNTDGLDVRMTRGEAVWVEIVGTSLWKVEGKYADMQDGFYTILKANEEEATLRLGAASFE